MIKAILSLLLICLAIIPSFSQLSRKFEAEAQQAYIQQYLDADHFISVKYSTASLQGWEDRLWGEAIPWIPEVEGESILNEKPWTGSPDNFTEIEFNQDVVSQGVLIEKGKYFLYLFPYENKTWELALQSDQNGNIYEPGNAIILELQKKICPSSEYLRYEFSGIGPDGMDLNIKWDKTILSLRFEVVGNQEKLVASEKKEGEDFDSKLMVLDINISEAEDGKAYIEACKEKYLLYLNNGKQNAAESYLYEAIQTEKATLNSIYDLGLELIKAGKHEFALDILKYNYDRYNGEWPTNLGLMRVYSAMGNFPQALKFANAALKQAPQGAVSQSISRNIEKLKQKEDIN